MNKKLILRKRMRNRTVQIEVLVYAENVYLEGLESEKRLELKKKKQNSAFAINLIFHNDFRIFFLRQVYFPMEGEQKRKTDACHLGNIK